MTGKSSGLKLRIAVLQPSLSIMLEHLGRLDPIVACTRYCLEAVPALRTRDVRLIADSWSSTTEEILSASPNLVLASVPYRLESLTAILKSGCPVVTLAPHWLSDVYDDFRILGALLGAADTAERIVEEMQSTVEGIRNQADRASARPVVYCEEWGKPLIHSQGWVSELVTAAGGSFLGTPGSVTEPQAVAEADPDVMVFAWCGAGDRVPLERVIEKRQWHGLRAVQAGRVYCIPDDLLNTPATNLLDGLRALASGIHPEIFGNAPTLRTLRAAEA
jgi:iron complex transport system substrate-binding protein